ncbi:MAG TPA: glycosyltransferase family 4 protein [Ferruginibacter sp.]|nr:glycosyltransferase family 4 protein [Ferruginibacter sp.]
MKEKRNITFIIHDRVGGVAYMNHQIIEYGEFMDHYTVRILLFKQKEDKADRFTEKFKAHEVDYFNYSRYDNVYLTLKKLNKIINKKEGILVTNDGIELQSIGLFGTRSLVYAIVHDFYNLKLAFGYYNLIDSFICHTEVYTKALKSSGENYPGVTYLPHGVKIGEAPLFEEKDRQLKIVFIGRFVESKGVQFLYDIDSRLKEKQIDVQWILIGKGPLEQSLKEQWHNKKNVSFLSPAENEEVMNIARDCDLFVSPSLYEGYGIALLEAMSCGLVPLVYDLPIGISSVLPSDAGFKIPIKNIEGFVNTIALLNADRGLLVKIKKNAWQFVAKEYNIIETSKNYLQSFLSNENDMAIGSKKISKKKKSLGLLDKSFLPNIIVVQLKKIMNK